MDRPQHPATKPTETRDRGFLNSSEPALVGGLRLIWGRRRLVLGGSLGLALTVATILYLCPRQYTATFVYERSLTEGEYSVLLRRFYSQENLDKIIGRLHEQGLSRYVQQLDRARTQQSLEKRIRFDAVPMYPRRLQTTDPCTSARISAFQAGLLSITVFGSSQDQVAQVAAIVTGNIESVLPLYDIRNHLKESLYRLRVSAAEIEGNRFKLSTDLQKEKAKLESLQALDSAAGETAAGGVILQFNSDDRSRDTLSLLGQVRGGSSRIVELPPAPGGTAQRYNFHDFLPLSYQIRAAQSKIVELQETLSSDTERYNFYLQVLDLENRLLRQIEESLIGVPLAEVRDGGPFTYYTAQQYLDFVGEQLRACPTPALCDHLRSHLRKTENLIFMNTRAGERPVVFPLPKRALQNGILALLVSLMVTTFVAVLLEYRHGNLPARK